MNLNQIDLQGYILALFIRDDGQRFLLGSGYYEFVEKQLHFKANEFQNDIVEVQGNDGLLLAGQVRRATSQDFDGYVGDNTVSRAEIENKRRAFLAFFRKNYYYTVVYIFHDGTAIQRKKGFIVDAPEVQEIYQFIPKYHISLNFEDVNYYAYAEDSDGHEVYGKSAIIPLTGRLLDGGLIWDEYGATNQELNWSGVTNVFGTDININNPLNYRVPFNNIQIIGNSTQASVPSLGNKAPIKNVSGNITVTVSDTNNNVDSYLIQLQSELCKIGVESDVIYKQGGTWYLAKHIQKFTVAGNLTLEGTTSSFIIGLLSTGSHVTGSLNAASFSNIALCDTLPIGGNSSNSILGTDSQGRIRIQMNKNIAANINAMNQILNGMNIYASTRSAYHTTTALAGTLATELENLLGGQLFMGDNNITTIVGNSSEKPGLRVAYYTETVGGEGFIWEQGTGGGTTMVNVDSVDNVYPVWEIEGPAINPILTNITTGSSLGYNGAITNGQKLVVDMLNKTAKINDTSVITNITGDWLYFVKGNNEISYTTNNNDATASTIYWQEVIG